ncbi:MAG TPA: hypothetical protein VFG70_09440, partial [Gaiellaceae bacterium]|nr:hypothetical protein [Gaiellaceae bacterium]
GRTLDVANVIWCTGFRNDYSWIRFPLPLEEDGYPEQRHGAVSSLPGLYFVGLPFLHSFASMLVLGAGRDGKRVAKHIVSQTSASRGSAGRDGQTLVWNGTVADVRMRPEPGETMSATPDA